MSKVHSVSTAAAIPGIRGIEKWKGSKPTANMCFVFDL